MATLVIVTAIRRASLFGLLLLTLLVQLAAAGGWLSRAEHAAAAPRLVAVALAVQGPDSAALHDAPRAHDVQGAHEASQALAPVAQQEALCKEHPCDQSPCDQGLCGQLECSHPCAAFVALLPSPTLDWPTLAHSQPQRESRLALQPGLPPDKPPALV